VRVLFFGTPVFAARQLEALLAEHRFQVGAVITQPDRPAGRGGAVCSSPVKDTAVSRNIPVFQPHCLKQEWPALRAALSPLGAWDIGVVAAYGQLLPSELLKLPRAGCINIHASLLPRWRGAAPIQRAILAGDRETGVCLMRMERGLDSGPVFSVTRVAISDEDDYGALHDRLAAAGAALLARDLEPICAGEIRPIPQRAAEACYAPRIMPAEAQIDWRRPAVEISRMVRAFCPTPGAFSRLGGEILKIFKARPNGAAAAPGPPGEVVSIDCGSVQVRCGDDIVIAVDELQPAGKRRMSAADFIRGRSRLRGVVLGE